MISIVVTTSKKKNFNTKEPYFTSTEKDFKAFVSAGENYYWN